MSCQPFFDCFDFVILQQPVVTCSDPKSSTQYIYKNISQENLSKYRVDGCLIKGKGKKCDFLLLNCTKKKSYFIELKGSDLIKAVEQIDCSIDALCNSISSFTVNARIVLTRVNVTDLKNSKYLKLERKVKMLGGDLKKQTRQMTEIN